MVVSVAVGALGALIGSFLNVVIYRVPAGRSVVSPPSACGNCGNPVRPYDNIPVISWLVLRGRCRDCATRISARYPLVELACAVIFALVALRFLPQLLATTGGVETAGAIVQLVAYLYLAAISLALALIDIDVQRLPNAIVMPSYIVAAVLLVATAALTGSWDALLRAGIGAAALGAFYFLIAFAKPGAMGWGDVKLAPVLGAFLGWLGWSTLIVGAASAFLIGGLYAVVLLAVGRGRKAQIPFGPWMIGGAWVGIAAGPTIAAAYLGLFGLS